MSNNKMFYTLMILKNKIKIIMLLAYKKGYLNNDHWSLKLSKILQLIIFIFLKLLSILIKFIYLFLIDIELLYIYMSFI